MHGIFWRLWLHWLLWGLLLAGCGGPAAPTVPAARCPATAPPASAPLPTDVGPVLLADDLSTPAVSQLQQADTGRIRYAFDQGAYLLAVEPAQTAAWSRLPGSYQDVVVQVWATLASGDASSASSLLFRYQDDANFYRLHVAYNGFYSLERMQDGSPTLLIDWTSHPAIAQATPARALPVANLLRVELRGPQIGLWVNGTLLEATLDQTFAQGGVAVGATTFAQGAAGICFDDILIAAR